MTGYALANLLQIEDSVGDRAPGIEGRFSRKQIGSRDLGVSHFRYAPGVRSPVGHRHGQQEEAYIVVAGSGRVRLDDEVRDIGQWDVVRVAPPVVRAFEAGPEGLELIAVGGPRPEDGDGEMSDAPWPDEAQA
jgi:mannose-6-phosphate isomerase-like protein (cupin superfamily)